MDGSAVIQLAFQFPYFIELYEIFITASKKQSACTRNDDLVTVLSIVSLCFLFAVVATHKLIDLSEPQAQR